MLEHSSGADAQNFNDKVHSKMGSGHEPFMVQGFRRMAYRDWNGDVPGEWITHFEEKNVIVNNARKIMAHLLGDCSGPYDCVREFQMGGDNALTAQEMLTPQFPTPDNQDMVYTINRFSRHRGDQAPGGIPLFSVSYPEEPNETSVEFTVRILKEEANLLEPNPTVYTAAGLFFNIAETAVLFASQTFPVMTKTSNREFIFEWSIRF